MKVAVIVGAVLLVLTGLAAGWETGSVSVKRGVMDDIGPSSMDAGASCIVSTYYLLDACGYATVVEGVGADETFGVRFSMTEANPFHSACDTSACMRLDIVELVFYDVLAPPADQSMNMKVYGADSDGNMAGGLLGEDPDAVV